MSIPSAWTITLLSDSGSKRAPFRYQLVLVSGGPEPVQLRISRELAEMITGDAVTLEMMGLPVQLMVNEVAN